MRAFFFFFLWDDRGNKVPDLAWTKTPVSRVFKVGGSKLVIV